jgi:hypothetical protein
MTRLDCEAGRAGRSRVDLHADVNLGEFGLLIANRFSGPASSREAIVRVLGEYSFPRLNVVFSASSRLLDRDENDLEVGARLEEMEMRLVVESLDAGGRPLDPARGLRPEVLGLYPFESRSAEREAPVRIAPRLTSILDAVEGVPPGLSGVLSGLGLTFASLLGPAFPTVHKAFMAGPDEFGWYVRSREDAPAEGLHYGTAFLQIHRKVAGIRVHGTLATDWAGGGVDNQICRLRTDLEVPHPPTPETPILVDPG